MTYQIVHQGKKHKQTTYQGKAIGATPYFRTLLEWTTTPPTEEGWYWVYEDDSPFPVKIVSVEEKMYPLENGENKLEVWKKGWDVAYEIEDFTHWLGPLPKPEFPLDK